MTKEMVKMNKEITFDLQLFVDEIFVATSSAENITVTNDGATAQKGTKAAAALTGKEENSTYAGVNAGSGADKITVKSGTSGKSIAGGRGNDVITIESNAGGNVYIYNYGDGKDTIQGWDPDNDKLLIIDDTISKDNASMSADGSKFYLKVGTSGYIYFDGIATGKKIKVYNGAIAEANLVEIEVPKIMMGNTGADTISNLNTNANKKAGTDATDYWAIDAKAGNDVIFNDQKFISINGGAGNDSIVVQANGATKAEGVTIRGGEGNDTIDVSDNATGHVYEFGAYDGYDTIIGYNESDTLVFSGFSKTGDPGIRGEINNKGDFVITAGGTFITLKKPAGKELGGTKLNILIKANDEDTSPATVTAETTDTVPDWLKLLATPIPDKTVEGKTASFEIPKKVLDTNAGNRLEYNSAYDNYSINAAAGNDTITVDGAKAVSLDAGAGNDSIVVKGGTNIDTDATDVADARVAANVVTIQGGYGNDSIDVSDDKAAIDDTDHTEVRASHVYQVYYDHGRDTIKGYNENDSIQVMDGTTDIAGFFDSTGKYFVVRIGDANVYLELSDYFKGGKKLNIVDAAGAQIALNTDNNFTAKTTYYDADDNEVAADSSDKIDEKTKTEYFVPSKLVGTNASDGKDSSDQIILTNIDDNFTVEALNGNDLIQNKGASNVYINAGAGDDTVYLTSDGDADNPVYGDNVTIEGGLGNDVIYSEVKLDADGKVTTTQDDDSKSKGHVFFFGYADGYDTINYFGDNDTIQIASDSTLVSSSVSGTDLIINVGNVYDPARTTARIILKEYLQDDSTPLVEGKVDYDKQFVVSQWKGSAYVPATLDAPRELVGTTGSDAVGLLTNNNERFTISALAGNDTVLNESTGEGSSIYGGAGNDSINNKAASVYIDAGYGNDVVTLSGSAGANTIVAGYGNDSIFAADGGGDQTYIFDVQQGTNYIVGFTPGTTSGSDKLQFAKGITKNQVKVDVTTEGVVVTVNEDGDGALATKIILKGALNAEAQKEVKRLNEEIANLNPATDADDIATKQAEIAAIKNDISNYADLAAGDKVRYEWWDTTTDPTNPAYKTESKEVANIIVGTNSADITYENGTKSGVGNIVITEDMSKYDVDAKAGNDNISVAGSKNTINAGLGNDTITLSEEAEKNTITAGEGNDYIVNDGAGNRFEYTYGDGIDTIVGFTTADSLFITNNASYTTEMSAEGLRIKVYDDYNSSILIKNATGGDKLHITNNNDQTVVAVPKLYYRTNVAEEITVDSALNDNYTVRALNGDDSITVASGDVRDILVDAGSGNDIINVKGGSGISIVAGYGNDTVNVESDVTTGRLYLFDAYAQGVNVINGLNARDTIQINYAEIPAASYPEYYSIKSAAFDSEGYFVLTFGDGRTQVKLKEAYQKNDMTTAYRQFSTVKSFNLLLGDEDTGTLKPYYIPNIDYVTDTEEHSYDDTKDDVVVIGDSKNNQIIIDGASYASIDAGAGNDSIQVLSGNSASITGGKGNDSIYMKTGGHVITYNRGDGDDTISGWMDGDRLNIVGYTTAEFSTLMTGAGGNVFAVKLGGNTITFDGIEPGGRIEIIGSVTDTALASTEDGHKYITVPRMIQGTTGNDALLSNSNDAVAIEALNGDDYIVSTGNGVTVKAGLGNDTVDAKGDGLNVLGGGGDDSIKVDDSANSTINAGNGNDTVIIGENVSGSSIIGGTGDDLIIHNGNVGNTYVYDYGTADQGNDTIYGFSFRDTLQILGASIATKTVTVDNTTDPVTTEQIADVSITANGLVISINGNRTLTLKGQRLEDHDGNTASDFNFLGAGTFTIKTGENAADTLKVVVTNEKVVTKKDPFENSDASSFIKGTTAADTITNYAQYVSIDANRGNDVIINEGKKVSISAGAGNDTIYIGSSYETVTTGNTRGTVNEDRHVENTAENVTINAGAGDDVIWGNSNGDVRSLAHIYEYKSGDGRDTIYGFGQNDSLKVLDADGNVVGISQNDIEVINTTKWVDGEIQEENANGELLYTDPTGAEGNKTTDETRTVTIRTTTDFATDGSGNPWYLKDGGDLANKDDWTTDTTAQQIYIDHDTGEYTTDGTYDTENTRFVDTEDENKQWYLKANVDATDADAVAAAANRTKDENNAPLYTYTTKAGSPAYTTDENQTVTLGDDDKVADTYLIGDRTDANDAANRVSAATNKALYSYKTSPDQVDFNYSTDETVSKTTANGLISTTKYLTSEGNINDKSTWVDAAAGNSEIYSYTDAEGETHYTTETSVSVTYNRVEGTWVIAGTADAAIGNRSNWTTSATNIQIYTYKDKDNNDVYTTATTLTADEIGLERAVDGEGKELYLVAGGSVDNPTDRITAAKNTILYTYTTTAGDPAVTTTYYTIEETHEEDNDSAVDGTGNRWYLKAEGGTFADTSTWTTDTTTAGLADTSKNIYFYTDNDGKKVFTTDTSVVLDNLPFMIDGKIEQDDPDKKDILVKVGAGSILIKGVEVESLIHFYTGGGSAFPVPKIHKLATDEATSADNPFVNTMEGYQIVGNARANYVENSGNSAILDIGNGENTISNTGADVDITTGDNADTITNEGTDATIDAKDGLNTVINKAEASGANITTGKDADTITNYAAGVIINAGNGQNLITNEVDANNTEITTGEHADTITNRANDVSITAGDSADILKLESGSGVIVDAGEGNDTIFAGATGSRSYVYRTGDGHDIISGWSSADAISLVLTEGESYETSMSAQGYVISIVDTGESVTGSITITNLVSDGNGGYTRNPVSGVVQIAKVASESAFRNITDDDFVPYEIPREKYVTDSAQTISATDKKYLILGDANSNTITNFGNQNTISALAQNDTIYNTGDSVSINAGAGDDYIVLKADANSAAADVEVTINAGTGNDTIIANDARETRTTGIVYEYTTGDGNDTIEGFIEDDIINITGSYTTSVDAQNNFIINVGNNGSIMLKGYNEAGSIVQIAVYDEDEDEFIEEDPIYVPKLVSIQTAERTTTNNDNYAYIVGTDGADSITYEGSNGTINGGNSADSIVINGDNPGVVVSAGGGEDTIVAAYDSANRSSSIIYTFGASDGGNRIEGFNSRDVIRYTGGEWEIGSTTTLVSGKDLVLTLGRTQVTLVGYGVSGNTATVIDAEKTTSAVNVGNVVAGTNGRDTLTNTVASAEIYGYNNNDSIYNNANSVSIWGGNGNDSITHKGTNSSIDGGAGEDYITIEAGSAGSTVMFGAGTDSVTNKDTANGHRYIFKGQEESVTIDGYGANDTIQIDDDSLSISYVKSSAAYSNGYFTFTIGNTRVAIQSLESGGFTPGTALKVVKSDGTTRWEEDIIPPLVYTMTNADHDIASYVRNAGEAGEKAAAYSANGYYVMGTSQADTIANNKASVSIMAGAGNDYIKNESGGTGVSINAGAGDDTIENAVDGITILAGAGNDSIKNTATDGVTYYFTANNENTTIDGWNANDTIYLAGTRSAYELPTTATISSDYKQISLQSNDGNYFVIKGQNDATLQNAAIRVSIAGSLSTTDYPNGYATVAPSIINLTEGDDPFESAYTGFNVQTGNGKDTITVKHKQTTITGGAGNKKVEVTVSSAPEDSSEGVVVNLGSGADSITNKTAYTSINAGAGNDSIDNQSGGTNATIFGGAGDDSITNAANNVSINGGAGDDEITISGGNNVTVWGGAGDDTIKRTDGSVVYYFAGDSGNTTIKGFGSSDSLFFAGTRTIDEAQYLNATTGSDYTKVSLTTEYGNIVIDGETSQIATGTFKIRLNNNNESINTTTLAVSTVQLTDGAADDNFTAAKSGFNINTGAGADTIKVTAKQVTVTGGSGNKKVTVEVSTDPGEGEGVIVGLSSGADTVDNKTARSSIYAGSGDDTISNNKDYVTVFGGNGNDSISTSGQNGVINGGADDDYITIDSGAQNNSVLGAAGNDSIVVKAGGNNTIYGGEGNDSIKIESDASGNVFYYLDNYSSEGVDTIVGFGTSDTIYVNNANANITDSEVTSGSGESATRTGTRLTLDDGTQIVLNGVNSGTVKVKRGNKDVETYTIGTGFSSRLAENRSFVFKDSSIALEDLFGAESDRYTTDNANDLSAITNVTADNFSAGNIEGTDYSQLAQDSNSSLASYGNDDK